MDAFTVGVEEEYQLVEPVSGELVSRARDVLEMDWAGEAVHEIQETQIEVGTRICGSAEELCAELRRLRFHVASAAAARDLVPVAAGLHPFSRWEDQEHTQERRYQRLREHYGRVIESEHVFGMHVHVAIPESVDRMTVIKRMRPYLPHLVALAASSPVFEGGDTEYDSYRTILNDRLPCSGPPPMLESEAAYWAFTAELISLGVALDEGTTYWAIRPHHTYPTIEVRCPDVCPRVEDAVAIGALVRALALAACEGRISPPETPHGASAGEAHERTAHWRAARFGLRARVPEGGGTTGPRIPEAVARLVDRVAPFAEELGDAALLGDIHGILERGNGADRIRARVAEEADREADRESDGESDATADRQGARRGLREVVRWLAGETLLGTGMDRRRSQRPEEERLPR